MKAFGLPEFFMVRSYLLSEILYGKSPWVL